MKYTRQDLPAGGLEKIEALRKQIIEGKIKPPKSPEELKTFKP